MAGWMPRSNPTMPRRNPPCCGGRTRTRPARRASPGSRGGCVSTVTSAPIRGRARLPRPARLVRARPRRLLVGGRRAPGCDLPRAACRDAGPAGDAGHAVVPGLDAQLRRARPHARSRPGGRRRRRRRGRRGRHREGRHARGAARPRRPRPRRTGGGRGRAGRPGRRDGPELGRDAGGLPGHGLAGCGVVVVLAGLRRPCGARPLRPDRADGAGRGRRLPLQRPSGSTCASAWPACRRRCRR